jgi:hypothetical protein
MEAPTHLRLFQTTIIIVLTCSEHRPPSPSFQTTLVKKDFSILVVALSSFVARTLPFPVNDLMQ